MSKTILAIPSQMPGGMDSGMGMHFGHCDIYTIVELENGQVAAQSTLESIPHQQGGCHGSCAVSGLPRRQCASGWRHGPAPPHGLQPDGHQRVFCRQPAHRGHGRAGHFARAN